MTDWKKIEARYGKEIEEIKQHVKDYDYSHKGEETDKAVRSLLVDKLHKAKNTASAMMELAFRENIELFDIKRLQDELGMVINEIEKSRFKVSKENLEALVNHDVVLIKNSDIVKKATEDLHKKILESDVNDLEREIRAIRVALGEVKTEFEDREKLLHG